jgi:hypothetical protein
MTKPKTRPRRWLRAAVILFVIAQGGWHTIARAAAITSAQVVLSDPRPGQTGVNYGFSFTLGSSTVLRSFAAEVCTDVSGPCITPTGFSASGSVLSSQPAGFGDPSGWVSDSTAGALRFNNSSNLMSPSGSQTAVFTGITNPDLAGAFTIRLTTYSDDSYASPVDQANIVFAIVPGVQVTAVVDPTLSFSVTGVPALTPYKGSLSTSDRCTDSSNSIKFGSTSLPLQADTDYDCAQTLTTSTNGQGGYQVTLTSAVPGDTLRHTGNPSLTIPNWVGTNLAPTIPAGVDEVFAYTTNDSTLSGVPDRFTAADDLFAGVESSPGEVAYANAPVAGDSVNVGYRLRFYGYTEAGTYTGTVTYTCTATF